MHKQNAYKAALLLTCLSLLLGACQPAPGPSAPTATPKDDAEPSRPARTETALMFDANAPLPPRVVERTPAGGEELPPGGAIQLAFDQPMDAEKTTSALEVVDPQGRAVTGDVDWVDERTLTFTPSRRLETGALYFASLETDAASRDGQPLAEPYGFQFMTTADLQVSQVFPADGASGVAADGVITVIFNRPVTPLVIAEERDRLPQPLSISPPLEGSGEWINTSVYAFQPKDGLKSGTDYTVTVRAGLEDALGETSLAQDYRWSFATAEPGIEWFALADGRYNPQNNADKVRLDEYFTIQFLQPMDRDSAEAALTLSGVEPEPLALETEWKQDDMTLVVTPTQRLSLDSVYTLRLDRSAQAATGGALADELEWSFTTLPQPGIVSTLPADSETQSSYSGGFNIQFASPMRIETVKERIRVSPQPEEDIQWYYNDWDWSLNGYFLEPSTDYEVRFLPGMEDIYGNRTARELVVRFTTAQRDPYARLMMPYGAPMLRAGAPEGQEFYLAYSNIDPISAELYSLSPEQFMRFLGGQASLYEYNPTASALVWKAEEPGDRQLNERIVKRFQPSTEDGELLPPGFYLLGVDAPQVQSSQRFADLRQVFVASANLTFKTSDGRGLAWLTDLESGEPVSGKTVTVWDEHGTKLGEGQTDADGVAAIDVASPENSYSRYAIVNDGGVFGFASREWGSGVNTSDYGIWMDYYAPSDWPTVYAYTERPIYRPGQPVYFKGIVRVDDDLDYSIPDLSHGVQVKISNYQETVYNEILPLSEYGSFDGKFTLDNEAVLGYYTIDVDLNGDDSSEGSVTFNVAEYRKPEFQVSVEAGPANLLAGESFTAVVQADYYSGGGVADAAVSWSLVSDPFQFFPPDEYSGYDFQDFEQDVWGFHEDGAQGAQTVAEGQGRTDGSGRFTIKLPADLSEFKTGRRLTFEATITDIAQTAVSGRASIVAHQSKVYPGIKPASYVGKAGDKQDFDVVVLNWDGQPLAEQSFSVEIVERRWYSVQEQDASGRVEWKSTVEEIPAEQISGVTDADGKATVSFIPAKGGVYRAKTSAQDDLGNTGRASTFLWVAGDDFIPWQQSSDRGFNLVTDKRSYQPGETAEVLIASPFQGETYALVTVERGRVRSSEVLLLQNNSTVYRLPITPDLAPNVYISVAVVKGIDETNPRPNFKLGVAEIKVDTREQTLRVEVIPDREQAGPGEQVTYTVRTTNADGEPAPAELSLSLSDLATLSLLPPNSGPILNTFYSDRGLGVWTSMSLVNSLEDYNIEIEEEVQQGAVGGSGGGKGDGELGVIAVRQDFPDTALWEAHVVTGKNGEATVSVTLPDNLTTWRMDARAITLDTRVGQTTQDIVSTRPLLVRPQTPRFFIENDEAILGSAVHNNTQETLEVTVSLEGEGIELDSAAEQTVTIAAGSQAYVTWEALVPAGTERVDLVFRAEARGALSGVVEDASRPPQGTLDNQGLPVYHYAAPETVGTSGQVLAGGTQMEGILLPQSMEAYDAELTVEIAPSLAAGMTGGLTYLEHYPYECIEQTVSRFLPNVLSTRAMKAAGIEDLALESHLKIQVDAALQRLSAWQNPDGGWGWWKNNPSSPLTTAYVALGLYEAEQAGYTVSRPALDSSLNYLRRQTVPLTGLKEPWRVNRQAFLLYVLAHAEKPEVSLTVQMFEQRRRLDTYSQAYLAAALWEIDPDDPRLDTLLADFNSQAILSATGTHWEEKETDRWNWNTDTRTSAIVLMALSRIDPENPLNANAVRWLMSNRSGSHWQGTQETAWTLMALTGWMEASGELEADYDYAVQLNGAELGSGTADRDTLRETRVFTAGFDDLLKDELNRLAFARDDGPGNLYYTAHLKASLPVEQIAALDQGIIVARSYFRLDEPDTAVSEAQAGELLLARLTVVAPYALHYVVIDDPFPAGLEAVDQSLSTSPQSVEVPQQYSFEDMWRRGWGWWFFNHVQYYDEKVVLSADYLPAGTYVYTYLVRAGTVGVFRSIPATAQEFYFPEVYGRSAGGLFTVTP